MTIENNGNGLTEEESSFPSAASELMRPTGSQNKPESSTTVAFVKSELVFSELLNDPATKKHLCVYAHFHHELRYIAICNRSATIVVRRR